MTSLQKYMDSAVSVLQRFGITPAGEESQMAGLLQKVVTVNEPKVLAIARTFQYMGTFNQLVRDRVEDAKISDRYGAITSMFDSIRDDSKRMVAQLEDGKIDLKEKVENLWMRLVRGTPQDRFENIRTLYLDVARDTRDHLEREEAIMNAYIDFRFAVKEAEVMAHEVMQQQENHLHASEQAFVTAADAVVHYAGQDAAERSRLELARDEAQRVFQDEDKRYQLLKDVAENLTIGYNVGETLIAKLKQTHDIKQQVYQKAVTFFTTNEHVFTILSAVYTSQHGLHEATQTLESMKDGVNKGLEDVADLGRSLERAALKAGYGSTTKRESVQKLVDAIVSYQEESTRTIRQLRAESTENAKAIAQLIEDGKQRCRQAMLEYDEPKKLE